MSSPAVIHMREFTPTEQDILARLLAMPSELPVNVEQFLEEVFFSEQHGRALILQPAGRFGYLYLPPAVYEDERARETEMKSLIELMMLIGYLRDQGLVFVNGGVLDREPRMRFVSAMFQNPQPSTAHIVLNGRGDYTFAPEAICDRSDTVISRGVRFESDVYDLVAHNVSGVLYVSPALRSLIRLPALHGAQPQRSLSRYYRAVLWSFVHMVVLCAVAWIGYRTADVEIGMASAAASSRSGSAADVEALAAPGPVPASPESDRTEHYGVDLSRWNSNLLEPALETGNMDFVFVRATYGRSTDIDFERNWTLLRQRGIIRGAYHFYLVHEDPIEQVEHYLSVIGDREPLEIAPVIDVEELSFPPRATPPDVATVQRGLLSALAHIEARTQRVPMVYTNVSIGNTYMNDPRFSRYPLWIADWTTRSEPTLPEAWKEVGYRFWQRSSRYTLPAAGATPVDLDVFRGRRADIYR